MNKEKVINRVFAEIRASYSRRDTMLYGLGVSAAQDPLDNSDLRFVYEKELQALPSLSCVLAHPGAWVAEPELGINFVKLLHAEQRFELARPLPAEGVVVGNYRVSGLVDKGADRGAMLYLEKTLATEQGEHIGTVGSTYFLRGDGGCGDWGEAPKGLEAVPESSPDGSVEIQTSPASALIYRLSGDYNPLHADPAVARKAGFERPILHGLCTYGVACQSLVRGLCDFDATRLRSMAARFTRPVYPGERLRTQWWNQADRTVRFQCVAVERNEIVLDRGIAGWTA